MKNMINKRVFAALMAIALFFTYSPALSYAFTEMPENSDNALETEEVMEDIAVTEAEVDDTAVPAGETEEPGETEISASEGASAEEQDIDVQDESANMDALLSGLEAAEEKEDQAELLTFESKAAQAEEGSANALKAEDIRIFGRTRYDTTIEVAKKYRSNSGTKFKNVIVASGKNFPDALSGGYLAKVKNAPLLLVEPSVENKIAEYISNNIESGGKVYILGGTKSVSAAFQNKVDAMGIKPIRLGGVDRYETNLKILKEARAGSEDILICSGTGYADSLSASAVGKPILLVGDTLTESQKKYIGGLSTKQGYIIGGTVSVKSAVETSIKNLGFKTERLWGRTRYETSTEVAKKFFAKTKTVMLVYAMNFPDGLSDGPLAVQENAPIVLTASNNTDAARAYVKSAGAFRSITLGGPTLISYEAVEKIMGRTDPYIKTDKDYANIKNVGDTATIKVESNYGTEYTIKSTSNVIEVISKDVTYNEKGEPTETLTIKGKETGAAVILLKDTYSGKLARPSVTKPVIFNVGEPSVKNLYEIIDIIGYINRGEAKIKGKDKTVELSKNTDKIRIFLVNHSENNSKMVELVCADLNGDTHTYTSVSIPLNAATSYKTFIEIGEDEFVADVYQSDYTKCKNLSNTKEIIRDEKDEDKIVGYNENISDEVNNSINSAFKASMATWNSVLNKNYGMVMGNLGFAKY